MAPRKQDPSIAPTTIAPVPVPNTQDDVVGDGGQAELPTTAQRLLTGAIACFASKGYQASTTRDICNQADLSPGALYVYFDSKEHLLFELVQRAHGDLQTALEALPAAAPGDEEQLVVDQIRTLTYWHIENRLRARVAQTELPNLSDEHLKTVRAQRAAIEGVLRAPVVAGRESGVFHCADPQLFVRALLSLSIDVIRWYDPRGQYDAEDLAQSNIDILRTYLRFSSDGTAAKAG